MQPRITSAIDHLLVLIPNSLSVNGKVHKCIMNKQPYGARTARRASCFQSVAAGATAGASLVHDMSRTHNVQSSGKDEQVAEESEARVV